MNYRNPYLWLMLEAFENSMRQFGLFPGGKTVLLALSGGMDSTVLLDLLVQSGYNIAIAHCNHGLRGEESDQDEGFCAALAADCDVQFFTTRLNATDFQRFQGHSIQMAARELRYEWLMQLAAENDFNHILTAHHADDQIETMIINQVRGTGIRGLRGIPRRNGIVLRPLLDVTRSEIEQYAAANQVAFREDSSNESDQYERNFIRHKVIPLIKQINPAITRTFASNAVHMSLASEALDEFLNTAAAQMCVRKQDELLINRSMLLSFNHRWMLLHHLLQPFGFNETHIANVLIGLNENEKTGKTVENREWRLTVGRDHLVVTPNHEYVEIWHYHGFDELLSDGRFAVREFSEVAAVKPNQLLVNSERLTFPLTYRGWTNGDRFEPFGMSGSKLLSDLFNDHQLSGPDKEKVRVLVNGNGDIIWVIGLRSSERYRVMNGEENILLIEHIG